MGFLKINEIPIPVAHDNASEATERIGSQSRAFSGEIFEVRGWVGALADPFTDTATTGSVVAAPGMEVYTTDELLMKAKAQKSKIESIEYTFSHTLSTDHIDGDEDKARIASWGLVGFERMEVGQEGYKKYMNQLKISNEMVYHRYSIRKTRI